MLPKALQFSEIKSKTMERKTSPNSDKKIGLRLRKNLKLDQNEREKKMEYWEETGNPNYEKDRPNFMKFTPYSDNSRIKRKLYSSIKRSMEKVSKELITKNFYNSNSEVRRSTLRNCSIHNNSENENFYHAAKTFLTSKHKKKISFKEDFQKVLNKMRNSRISLSNQIVSANVSVEKEVKLKNSLSNKRLINNSFRHNEQNENPEIIYKNLKIKKSFNSQKSKIIYNNLKKKNHFELQSKEKLLNYKEEENEMKVMMEKDSLSLRKSFEKRLFYSLKNKGSFRDGLENKKEGLVVENSIKQQTSKNTKDLDNDKSKSISEKKNNVNLNLNLNLNVDRDVLDFRSKINNFFQSNRFSNQNQFNNNIYKKIDFREKLVSKNNRNNVKTRKNFSPSFSNQLKISEKKKKPKTEKDEGKTYLIQNWKKSIKYFLIHDKKDQYLKAFQNYYKNFQNFLNNDLINHKFIYSLNINMNDVVHKIHTKRYLILNLEKTLLYCSNKKMNCNSIYLGGNLFVTLRPYLTQFLLSVSASFNLILFTLTKKQIVDKILKIIDKNNQLFILKLFRSDCVILAKDKILKNLEFLQELNLKNCVIVDNKPDYFFKNLENVLPIIPFSGDANDTELFFVNKFLLNLTKFTDYRKVLSNTFQIKTFLNDKSFVYCIKELLNNLENN